MATSAARATGDAHLPISRQEEILRSTGREVSLLVASEHLTVTRAAYAPDERVAAPHIHRRHTDAFYVLEGELTFEIGTGPETITIGAGGFVAAPPGLAHSFRTADDSRARWLTIHARDGGYAAFMRGIRDGVQIDWDIAPVPAEGGLPADRAVISRPSERGGPELRSDRMPVEAR